MIPLWFFALLRFAVELSFWSAATFTTRDVVLYPTIGCTAEETLALSAALSLDEVLSADMYPSTSDTAPHLQLAHYFEALAEWQRAEDEQQMLLPGWGTKSPVAHDVLLYPIIGGTAEEFVALEAALGAEHAQIAPMHDTLRLQAALESDPILMKHLSNRRRRDRRRQGSSSSSSSSSSSADENGAGDDDATLAAQSRAVVNPVDPSPHEDRVDAYFRYAAQADQRTVYLWTFSYTDLEGHAKPLDFTHASFAEAVLNCYELSSKVVIQWSVFREVHPSSKSEREQHTHYHMIVETERPARWAEMAKRLRDSHNIYASAATSSARRSYWAAFAYLFTPSPKKPKEDLDHKYLLSVGHDDPPQPLVNKRSGVRRLQPLEIFKTIVEHNLDCLDKLFAFAARQHHAGDDAWLNHCIRSPEKNLKEQIGKTLRLTTAEARMRREQMSHMEVLEAALDANCICQGHAIPGWEMILTRNGFDVAEYCASMRKLFLEGGGKALNHLYVGEPNSGKTGLTKPLLALFGSYTFLKPQVGTSFALQGLVGAQAVIWNDFRWPHPPLAWGDLLNMLDNEPFNVGVPKVDGDTDVRWNVDGKANVMAVITTNSEIVYITDKALNPVETKAFADRFGMVLHFKLALEKPDRRYRHWMKCTRCYAEWILRKQTVPETPEGKRGRTGPGPNSADRVADNAGSSCPRLPLPPAFPDLHDPDDAPQMDESWLDEPHGDESQGTNQDAAFNDPTQSQAAPVHDAGQGAHVGQGSVPLPDPQSTEPVRAMNLFLSKSGVQPEITETEIATQTWQCRISALGVAATCTATSKKAAKKEAASAFLKALSGLA